jgi:hypothetical protein
MLVEAVTPLETPFEFSYAGVLAACMEAERPDFNRTALQELREFSPALAELHAQMLRKAIEYVGVEQAFEQSEGYLLAFQVLKNATSKLMTVGDRLAMGYAERIRQCAPRLHEDFDRDYAEQGHVPVVSLIDVMLQGERRRIGAKIMFNIFGRQANPGREPILLPAPPEGKSTVGTQPGRSVKRRMGALTGARSFR